MKESTEKSASQFQAMALKRLEHFFKNHANPNSVCKLMHIRGCKKHKIRMIDGLGDKIRSSSDLTGLKQIK